MKLALVSPELTNNILNQDKEFGYAYKQAMLKRFLIWKLRFSLKSYMD
jgi:hypothetical protein